MCFIKIKTTREHINLASNFYQPEKDPFVLGKTYHGYTFYWVRVAFSTSCSEYEFSWVRVIFGKLRLGYEL